MGFLVMEESRRRRRNKQEAPAGASTSTEDICAPLLWVFEVPPSGCLHGPGAQ